MGRKAAGLGQVILLFNSRQSCCHYYEKEGSTMHPRRSRRINGRISIGFAAAVLLLLCVTGGAFAQQQDTLQLVGVNPNGYSYLGDYLSPYVIAVNGVNNYLACDDYVNTIAMGAQWTAYAYSWSQVAQTQFYSSQGTYGYFNGTSYGTTSMTGAQAYQEAFFLASNILNSTVYSDQQALTAVNMALWYLFDTSISTSNLPSGSSTPSNNTSYWLTQAQTNYGSVNLSNFTVYTPSPIGSSQEFIGVGVSTSPVPIPPSALLLVPGLLGLVGLRKGLKLSRGR